MRIDCTRIDLMGVDFVRIDLMGIPLWEFGMIEMLKKSKSYLAQ